MTEESISVVRMHTVGLKIFENKYLPVLAIPNIESQLIKAYVKGRTLVVFTVKQGGKEGLKGND